ncbi:Uncharacterised protein [Chlamydia trachomatis]|nr:Uncharacterised protein [Chlamydia trachomatis]
MIHTEKLGNNYNREVDRKRKTYKSDQIDDPAILKILNTIDGAVIMTEKKSTKTSKTKQTEASKQAPSDDDEIFKEIKENKHEFIRYRKTIERKWI